MCSQAESEQLVSCTKEKQDYSKVSHSIAWERCKNILVCFSPLWLDEKKKKVVRSRTSNTAKKNERKTYSQNQSVIWIFCLSPACLIGYICNWIPSGKSLFSAGDRTSTEALRDTHNLIIRLFWWFWSINDLDKRLPVSFKNHDAYFRLAHFNFLVSCYVQNHCHLARRYYVIIAQSAAINKMQNQKEKAILVSKSLKK